jgi:hypothetical protein
MLVLDIKTYLLPLTLLQFYTVSPNSPAGFILLVSFPLYRRIGASSSRPFQLRARAAGGENVCDLFTMCFVVQLGLVRKR